MTKEDELNLIQYLLEENIDLCGSYSDFQYLLSLEYSILNSDIE